MARDLRAGFIGLGAMGFPMASNILRAGFPLSAYDVRPEAVAAIQSLGATPCSSAQEVASRSDVVFSMLPNSEVVEDAFLGPRGVVQAAREGLVLVEMSTTSISTVRKINEALSPLKCQVLDAPVSGVPLLAESADISIMVGGDEKVMEKCMPLLLAMGKRVSRTGGIGTGRVAKFINNMLVTLNLLSSMEILAWARKAGADYDGVVEVVRNSMSYSRIFEHHVQTLANRKEEDYMNQHIWFHKDLRLLLDEAEAMGSALPLTAQAKQLLHSARNMSGGAETMGSLLSFFDTVTGSKRSK